MEIATAAGTSVAGKAATVAVDGIWQQIQYVLDYSENMQELRTKLQVLKDARERVLHQVEDAAKRLQQQIENDVQTWLKNAEEEIAKVEKILQEDGEARKSCCTGLLPNFKNRHKFSRRAKIEAPATENVATAGKFNIVGYRVQIETVVPINGYETFESRNVVFQSIVMALKDGNVDMVGVWGLGGAGKTTLTKKIAKQLKAEGIFQSVAIIELDQEPDPRKIQSDIAESLDFKLEVESKGIRSSQLYGRIKQEQSLLLILDNVWKNIELEEIGIPIGGDNNPCKILITSRNENVLLEMGAKSCFRLDALTDEEAWKLFSKKVGAMEDLGIQHVAAKIVERCAGLPILILPVAAALRNKELYEWKVALETLKKFVNQDITAKAHAALELSYNSLGEDAKLLFLLCAQFAPRNIYIPFFFPHSVGLGMFAQCSSLEAKRDMLFKVVNDIRSASLLLEGDYFYKKVKMDEVFKMHDVVHGFAFSMLSKDDVILEHGTQLKEWPSGNDLKNCTRIFLPFCKIVDLPAELECPKLVSFTLWRRKDSSLKIPDDFFQGLTNLKVLDLCEMNFSLLPSSLQLLTNLRTLNLYSSILGDISVIGVLKKLEILILQECKIAHFPKEIAQLTCLQLLDLSESDIDILPPNVLSCLTELVQLFIGDSFLKWGLMCSDAQRMNAGLVELKSLSKLTDLDIKFTDLEILPANLFSNRLERFFIIIGDRWEWDRSRKIGISRTLKLKHNASIHAIEKINGLLKRTEDLYLDSIGGTDVDLVSLDSEGFHHLKNLQLRNCDHLQYVVNLFQRGRCMIFPRLESLVVESSQHLEQLYNGSPEARSLNKLKQIKIRSCDGLRNLFDFSFVECVLSLEEIEVIDCEKLEGIFVAEEIINDGDGNKDEVIEFTMLRRVKLEYLPCLAHFGIHTRKNEAFFNGKIVFPNIEDLTIRSIKVEKIWDFGLPNSCICIAKLTNLVIDGCKNMKTIFATSMLSSLAQVKVLKISDCKLLKEVIAPVAHEVRIKETKICFPKLELLELKHLHCMVTICTGDLIECSNLETLVIEDCPKLKTFITSSLGSGDMPITTTLFDDKVMLPNLEVLKIHNMHSLTMLWHGEIREASFCKLKVLSVEGATNLRQLFPSSMFSRIHEIEKLRVEDCSSLEEIFYLPKYIGVKGKHDDRILKLKSISASQLPNLKHIWNGDTQGILSFEKLRKVSVRKCLSLESLFLASIAKQLLRLEELEVFNCSIKQIISEEKKVGEGASFRFPNLKVMKLWGLFELNSFYPGRHIVHWPALEHASVINCPGLELFKCRVQNTSDTEKQCQQPLFSFEEVVPKLEVMSLSSEESLMIMQRELPNILSPKLKDLHLHNFCGESVSFPVKLLKKFPTLERIQVHVSDFEELFNYQVLNEEKDASALSQIKHLTIHRLPALKHIWNPPSHLHSVVQNLEYLRVHFCNSLMHLAPESAAFDNLTEVVVFGCENLVSLFTCSTATSLKKLKILGVKNCSKLEEIVSTANESEAEINFHGLEILELINLGNMTSFCSKNYALKFPSLERLTVEECPQMELFCPGHLSAPKLKTVWLTEDRDRSRWKADLNTTIRQLYKERAQDSLLGVASSSEGS